MLLKRRVLLSAALFSFVFNVAVYDFSPDRFVWIELNSWMYAMHWEEEEWYESISNVLEKFRKILLHKHAWVCVCISASFFFSCSCWFPDCDSINECFVIFWHLTCLELFIFLKMHLRNVMSVSLKNENRVGTNSFQMINTQFYRVASKDCVIKLEYCINV